MRYPPFSAMANVLVRNEKKEMAMRLSSELGSCSRRPGKAPGDGAAEAPVARVKNEYRYQFLIKAASRTALNELLQRIRSFALERKWGATALVIGCGPALADVGGADDRFVSSARAMPWQSWQVRKSTHVRHWKTAL